MDEELELNTLHRLHKHSGRLILEQHGSCEVPAGCGGLVMRWLNPAQECYLLFTIYAAGKFQLFLDGDRLQSSRQTVPLGTHVLGVHCLETGFLMMAVQRHTQPKLQTLLTTAADGFWRGTTIRPPEDWSARGFSEDWPALVAVAGAGEEWRRKRLDEMGAQALGFGTTGPLWVRREFELS